ncbi:MAG: hypothetical protein GC191_17510 [Azospirillum sp.]|nr:hypothetical protein [Azospirillum sp.]
MPRGTVRNIEFYDYDNVEIILRIEGDDGQDNEMSFDSAELTAITVNYCLDRKIKLPAKVAKWVELLGKSLSLLMDISKNPHRIKNLRGSGRSVPALKLTTQ